MNKSQFERRLQKVEASFPVSRDTFTLEPLSTEAEINPVLRHYLKRYEAANSMICAVVACRMCSTCDYHQQMFTSLCVFVSCVAY